jgi:hypothetical protein
MRVVLQQVLLWMLAKDVSHGVIHDRRRQSYLAYVSFTPKATQSHRDNETALCATTGLVP